jgi:hypothetical protein
MGNFRAYPRSDEFFLSNLHIIKVFIDPGSAAEDTGGIHRLISATVTMCGIFIISTLIGALTTGMEGKLAELRKGRTKVIETNHTSKSIFFLFIYKYIYSYPRLVT